MATRSSVLAWRIPGTGEPGGLLSMESHRVGHDWSDLAAAAVSLNPATTVTLLIWGFKWWTSLLKTQPLSTSKSWQWPSRDPVAASPPSSHHMAPLAFPHTHSIPSTEQLAPSLHQIFAETSHSSWGCAIPQFKTLPQHLSPLPLHHPSPFSPSDEPLLLLCSSVWLPQRSRRNRGACACSRLWAVPQCLADSRLSINSWIYCPFCFDPNADKHKAESWCFSG